MDLTCCTVTDVTVIQHSLVHVINGMNYWDSLLPLSNPWFKLAITCCFEHCIANFKLYNHLTSVLIFPFCTFLYAFSYAFFYCKQGRVEYFEDTVLLVITAVMWDVNWLVVTNILKDYCAFISSWTAWPGRWRHDSFFKMSVTLYQLTQCSIPEGYC
jgi:hypothetical protein